MPANQAYREKEQLRYQVMQLNELIQKYQYEIQRLRQFDPRDDGNRELEQLLGEAEMIETNTLKLLRQNVEGRQQERTSQRVPTS